MSDLGLVRVTQTVVPYRDRKVSLVGMSINGAIGHLREHLVSKEKWCEVGCMARFSFGRNTDSNRAKVRRSVRSIFRALLADGVFLVISYDPANHGRIDSMKLYEAGHSENQHALLQLKRMLNRKQLSDELFESAKALIRTE